MVVFAFRCRKYFTARVRWGIALSSINTGCLNESRQRFQQCPFNIFAHSDFLEQLAIMRNGSPHYQRTTAKWNGFLDVAGGTDTIWLFHQSYAEESGFHRTSESLFAIKYSIYDVHDTIQTCCFLSWGQKGTLDRPPGSIPSSLQPIPSCPR